MLREKKSHFFISPFRPQDGNKPAETSQPQSSTGGYNQPSLGYGQSNYSYPQVPGSYPMQPVSAPPSYPPTRSVFSCLFLWPVSWWENNSRFFSGCCPACFCFLRWTVLPDSPRDKPGCMFYINTSVKNTSKYQYIFATFFFLIYSDKKQWHESR